MDTTMELDDFRAAWRALDTKVAIHQQLHVELLREHRLDTVRRGLRPLMFGQCLQLLLGVAVTVLGVACWTRNVHVPGLLIAGITLHGFGVLTAVMAGLTMGLAASIDYAAPVVTIQRQMARLLKFQTLNSSLCAWPWWIMWVPVVLGVAGLDRHDPAAGTPLWIWVNLAVGLCGLLATWAWTARHSHAADADPYRDRCDGFDGIRRGRRLLDEIADFERE